MEANMSTTTLTSAWEAIILNFSTVFTQPTVHIFINLITGWILCTARRTITGILPFAEPKGKGKRPHDAYHRLFPKSRWLPAHLWRLLAQLLIGLFCPVGTIWMDLDDTIFHRTGRNIDGAGWWRDPILSTASHVVHCWGLNLVVLTLRVIPRWGGEPLGLPINMRLHRKNGPGLIELATQMLAEVKGWFPERQFMTSADGFYASLAGCGLLYTHLISRMRRDAAIYALPKKKPKHQRGPKCKKGKRLATPTQIASRVKSWLRVKTQERGKTKYRLVYSKVVIWYKVSHRPVLLVISRDPAGNQKDDFFFTTDLNLTPAEVIGGFAGRWSIEDTFKNTKQSLGSEEPQTWKGQGPQRAAVISLWLYSVVWAWYIRYGHGKTRLPFIPWYPSKSYPSFQDALAALRRVLWRKRIIVMFGNHTVPARITEFLIDALAPAA
jgi:hypothetical protein